MAAELLKQESMPSAGGDDRARAYEFSRSRGSDTVILLIAAFKLIKALLLIPLGSTALRLLHRNVQTAVTGWLFWVHLNPESRWLHALVERLGVVDAGKLEAIGFASFAYAAIFLTEGIGLAMRKRWAE